MSIKSAHEGQLESSNERAQLASVQGDKLDVKYYARACCGVAPVVH